MVMNGQLYVFVLVFGGRRGRRGVGGGSRGRGGRSGGGGRGRGRGGGRMRREEGKIEKQQITNE